MFCAFCNLAGVPFQQIFSSGLAAVDSSCSVLILIAFCVLQYFMDANILLLV